MSQCKMTLAILGSLVVISIVILVINGGNKKPEKQGWGAVIGIGAYPPTVDPTYYDKTATTWSFKPTQTMTSSNAGSLIDKWAKFVHDVSPEISGTVYSLFPDLQTSQSIDYYGVSERMIYVLTRISDLLDDPSQYKTPEDVYRIFSPVAINIFDMELGIKPESGLYHDWNKMGWGMDVL